MYLKSRKNNLLLIISMAVLTAILISPASSGFAQTSGDTIMLTDEQKIMNVLENLKKGAEERNVDLYMSCFSRNFSTGNLKYENVHSDISGAFQVNENITCNFSDISINIVEETATVTYIQDINQKNIDTGKTNGFSLNIKNTLKKEGDDWKIYSLEWSSPSKSATGKQ